MASGEASESLVVRPADPRTEADRILPVLARNLTEAGAAARYAWLYLENPHGPARVWVAETRRGEVVGTSAGHPKRAWIDGHLHDVLDLSDFSFDAGHRSAGPALQLLRATLAGITPGAFTLSYDHPSPAMLALYRRLGGRDVSARRRWVRLLEVSGALGRRLGPAGRLLGLPCDLALRTRDAIFARRGSAVSLLRGACGEEFDRLDEQLRAHTRFRVQRSSALLRWRFQANPIAGHEILCAREGGALCGYLVFRPCPGRSLALVDLLTVDDPTWAGPLLDALVALGHARWRTAVFATVLRGSPVERLLARHRFVAREENAGLVITAPAVSGELAAALQVPDHWWMLEGDEDV
jgi:hypothetical protein